LSDQTSIPWFTDFLGVAYRYYDLRMNVVPLFSERKEAVELWHGSIRWWIDPTIRVRFVETDDKYWFVMGADSVSLSVSLSMCVSQCVFVSLSVCVSLSV